MSADASLVDYYTRRAAEYERIYKKTERQEDLKRLLQLLAHALVGHRVLEVACGTGYWTEAVANVAESVTGLDCNEEVLQIARSKPIDPAKVRFLREDAYELVGIPGRFTAGFAAFWWSHIPKSRLKMFLDQFHRKLAPGALVVFMDNRYVEGSSTRISRADDEGNTYQQRRLDDGSTFEIVKNFPSPDELRKAIGDDMTQVRVELLKYYWFLSYVLPVRE